MTGYVGKSKIKSSGARVRSKSMRSRGRVKRVEHLTHGSRHSRHSRRLPERRKPGRFNEELESGSRKSHASRASQRHSKAVSQASRPSRRPITQQAAQQAPVAQDYELKSVQSKEVPREDRSTKEAIEKVSEYLKTHEDKKEQAEQVPDDHQQDEERAPVNDEKIHDEIDSLYYGDGYSEYSRGTRRTGQTSATYISKLERELQDERVAREKLEKELEEIKRISSEISSHLGLSGTKPAAE